MRKIIWAFCLSMALCGLKAQTLPLNTDLLKALKTAYNKGDKSADKTMGIYKKAAEKAVNAKAPTVRTKRVAPSNDPRDYVSLSRYWWPDSTKADGLPYVRRDGEVNPEIHDYAASKAAGKMANGVEALAVMYYVTGDTLYASHCTRYLRAWFTDLKTGMNPNMTYAQIIPGRSVLRGTGVLDAHGICRALCMSSLLDGYKGWTSDDRRQLRAWGEAFLYWIEHSTQGQKEHAAKNNHGLWFDVTHMELLAFLGYPEEVRRVATDDLLGKLDVQIAADGSLPEELARTLSLHYSTYVMEAIVDAANLAKGAGMNLWQTPTRSGKHIGQIVDYLLPYYKKPQQWQYRQISPFKQERATVVLYEAGEGCKNDKYLKLARQIGMKDNTKLSNALYHQLTPNN